MNPRPLTSARTRLAHRTAAERIAWHVERARLDREAAVRAAARVAA